MAEMGGYCKAYLLEALRVFPGFRVDQAQARPTTDENGEVLARAPRPLGDRDILYVQEDFSVTDGIYKDEYVVYRGENPEWKAFCAKELGFAVPEFARTRNEVGRDAQSGNA